MFKTVILEDEHSPLFVFLGMKKKLRIAIVIDWVDTTLWWSYVSAQKFALWLSERWHHIVWIASTFTNEKRRKDFTYATLYEVPSSFPLWPQKTRFALPSVRRLLHIFKKEQVDIVYSIHPSYIWWQAYRAAKKIWLSFVSHSHIRPELLAPKAPTIIKFLLTFLVASLYKKSDGVIYPTAFTQNLFSRFSFSNKQAIISNWVDTSLFCPWENKKHNGFLLLYMWRLDVEKRVSLIIDAVHILKQREKLPEWFSLLLVWWWSEEDALRKLSYKYWLDGIISFAWKVDPWSESQITMYQQASAFVLPSTHELEGMVVLESMACWIPLLIADSPTSAATAFINGNWYLFTTAEDLADKLLAMISDEKERLIMWKKSLEQSKNFSFTLSVQKLESFLSSCI